MIAEVFESDFTSHIHSPEASFLLALWEHARQGRSMPSVDEIPRERLTYLEADLMILRPLEDDDWLYVAYGSRIAQQAGFNMTGKKVSDFKSKLGDFYKKLYLRVMTEKRPFGSLHRMGAFGEMPLWERLIVPIGDQAVERILVVNKVREVATDIRHFEVTVRGRGLVLLQFTRDAAGQITGSVLVGANALARKTVGRRLDELVGISLGSSFPELAHDKIWHVCASFAADRVVGNTLPPFRLVSLPAYPDVRVTPFLDGAAIDFDVGAALLSASGG